MDGTGKLGVPAVTDPTLVGTVLSFDTASAYFDPPSAGSVPLVVRGFTGQTANLINIRDGALTLKSWYTSDGRGVLASKSSAGAQLNPATNVDFAVFGAATGDIPLASWGVSGQTEDLLATINDPTTGTRMAGVKSDGRVYTPAIKLSITGAQSGGTGLIVAVASSADATNYPFGTSLREAAAADGWPANGLLETNRYTNRIFQRLTDANGRAWWRTTTTAAGPTWALWQGGDARYGELDYAEITTAEATGSTGTADIPGLSVTFTITETRLIVATAEAPLTSSASSDHVGLILANSGNTQLKGSGRIVITTASATWGSRLRYRVALASGTYTWKLRRTLIAGTGNVKCNAASTDPAFIMVEDCGLPS